MRRISILGGGGLMGHGMALAFLQGCECQVTLVSRRAETLRHGVELITKGPFGLERAVKKGRLEAARAEALAERIHTTTELAEGVAGADWVFESIPEEVGPKRELLRQVEELAPRARLASGTSAITISELAGALRDPSRLVGTHWFYPAHVMPLVEVARSEITSAGTLEAVVALLREIGKKPVVVRDSPGFFMTRFINLFLAEAMHLVELGVAGPAEIDEMVKTGLGWPMGVFELLDDTASFDSFYHAQEYLQETLGGRYAVPPLARRVFEAGYRGDPRLKPGSRGGWYDFLGAERPERPQR